MDVASLADLLRETAEHHGSFEAVAPPHDWWDWYAAYMDARQRGSTPEEASAAAAALHGGGHAHRRLARLTAPVAVLATPLDRRFDLLEVLEPLAFGTPPGASMAPSLATRT